MAIRCGVSSRKESPIALADVTVRYGQASEHALSNVTLDVGAGEIVAILGPNGAGKSTLLRVMTGSLTPTSGSATLFGQPLRIFGSAFLLKTSKPRLGSSICKRRERSCASYRLSHLSVPSATSVSTTFIGSLSAARAVTALGP